MLPQFYWLDKAYYFFSALDSLFLLSCVYYSLYLLRCLKWGDNICLEGDICVLADLQERRDQREVSLDVSEGAQRNRRMALNYWPAWQLTTLRLRFFSPFSLYCPVTVYLDTSIQSLSNLLTDIITIQTHLSYRHLRLLYVFVLYSEQTSWLKSGQFHILHAMSRSTIEIQSGCHLL